MTWDGMPVASCRVLQRIFSEVMRSPPHLRRNPKSAYESDGDEDWTTKAIEGGRDQWTCATAVTRFTPHKKRLRRGLINRAAVNRTSKVHVLPHRGPTADANLGQAR